MRGRVQQSDTRDSRTIRHRFAVRFRYDRPIPAETHGGQSGVVLLNIQPGQTLSHYRLIEKIGEGGMGVVWRAFDTRLERHVALKFLPPELTADPERRRRFLREARTAAAVTHPNIVTTYEIDEVDGITFICMELVDGRPLRSVIRERAMTIPQILRIAAEIAEGLARAHQEGIVHRDLKSDNVILGEDGRPRILDFGLAKLLEQQQEVLRSQLSRHETRTDELTREGNILGTPSYMSPEQARGETVDLRSDVFSFGILLYELVTRRTPFQGRSQVETLAAILHSPPAPASSLRAEVPPRLDDILGKCLEKDAGARYQSSTDLVVDLRRLCRDLESRSSPTNDESGAARAPGAPTRRWWPLALAVGFAVVLIGVALFVLRPGRTAPAAGSPAHARSEIAVLPFQNLNADESHAYFAGGLHGEVLTQLAKVAALKVISRTSVMGYQGTAKPLKQIASELGVGSVMEGSVQVVGERLRVNVQVIDAATDENIWAERYDRTLDDAFAIQSEVAQRIVEAVGATLTSREQGRLATAPTTNAEAYRLYLQGGEYYARPGYLRQDRETAEQLYERALALDPNFALAHAALSLVHGQIYNMRYDHSEARAARQLHEAETALRLAPDLPQAHLAMGRAHYQGRRDYRGALDEWAIALEGLPNEAELWLWIGFAHRRLGQWSETLAAFDRATRLNPRDADLFSTLGGTTYWLLHRYADAVREFDRALSLAPDLHDAAISRAWTYVCWKGQLDALRDVLSQLPQDAQLPFAGSVAAQRAELLLRERKADSLLEMPQVARGDDFESLDYYLPASLYAAWAHQLRGDREAARRGFDAARVRLDSVLQEFPEDWRLHAARGTALAGLGRRDEAREEARWLQQSAIYHEHGTGGATRMAEDRARIFAQAGAADAALDEIERLLAGPSFLSVHMLRLDPRWDPIREHPKFRALVEKYGAETAR